MGSEGGRERGSGRGPLGGGRGGDGDGGGSDGGGNKLDDLVRAKVLRWRQEFMKLTGINTDDEEKVKVWQRAHGLDASGKIRQETIEAARREAGARSGDATGSASNIFAPDGPNYLATQPKPTGGDQVSSFGAGESLADPHGPAGGDISDERAMKGKEKKPRLSDGTVEEGEGMLVLGVDAASIEKMRRRLAGRIDTANRMGRLAIERFESILRQRSASADLVKGFGPAAQGMVVGWCKDKFEETMPKVLHLSEKVADAIPVVGVGLEQLHEGIEGEAEAKQTAAKLDAEDQIVNSTREQLDAMRQLAQDKIAAMDATALLELDRETDYSRPPVTEADVDALVAKLDAMLTEAMFKSGTLTTREYLERLKARENLQGEIDMASKKHPTPRDGKE